MTHGFQAGNGVKASRFSETKKVEGEADGGPMGLCVIGDMEGLEMDESPEIYLPFNYMSRHK